VYPTSLRESECFERALSHPIARRSVILLLITVGRASERARARARRFIDHREIAAHEDTSNWIIPHGSGTKQQEGDRKRKGREEGEGRKEEVKMGARERETRFGESLESGSYAKQRGEICCARI